MQAYEIPAPALGIIRPINITIAAAVLALCWPASLCAQAAQRGASDPRPLAAPSSETLALARTLVAKSGGGGLMAMNGLSLPMARVMKRLHLRPDQSKTAVNDVIMPIMLDHLDELSEIQAQSYAATLSPDTLKAAVEFYDSRPGKEMVAAHGRMIGLNMQAIQALFDTLMPQFQAKADAVFKTGSAPKN